MGRRTLLLVAALLLAAIGTGVLFVFLQTTVKTTSGRSNGGSSTTLVVAPRQDIAEGTRVTTAQLQTVQVPAGLAEQAGYLKGDQLTKLDGKVATRRLTRLTPVTASAFGDTVTGSTSILQAPGSMTIAVEVDDAARVGTFLYPGARAALWLLTTTGDTHEARIVLPDVTVVTLGTQGTIVTPRPTASGRGTTARAASGLVVLQVDQEQAAKVLLAQQTGELYFTLLGDKTTPTPRSYNDSVLG